MIQLSSGGPGIICQIDESLFCHKQKYGKGRASETQTWVFGIADTSFSPARFYMEVVPNRSAETLLHIIARVCKPGTIIHSDKWAAYKSINRVLGFDHGSVNHFSDLLIQAQVYTLRISNHAGPSKKLK